MSKTFSNRFNPGTKANFGDVCGEEIKPELASAIVRVEKKMPEHAAF